MKKAFSNVLVSTMSLLLLPNLVLAEAKEVDDVIYAIDDYKLADILCDEIKDDKVMFGGMQDTNLVVFNETKDKVYLVDANKSKECKVLNDEEVTEIMEQLNKEADTTLEYYSWAKDNTIRKTYLHRMPAGYRYVLADKIEEGKTYYQKASIDGWVEARDDIDEPLYERYSFDYVTGVFDKTKEYYEDYIYIEGRVDKVENPNEEAFKNNKYVIKSTDEIEGEIIFTLTNPNFVLSKDITKLDLDIVFERENFVEYKVISGVKYLMFYKEGLPGLAIFKEDGTYLDSFLELDPKSSNNNILITMNANGKVNLRNNNYDLIYEVEKSDMGFDPYIHTVENDDYFIYTTKEDELGIIKVSYYELEEGANLTYNNKDLTIKTSGRLDLLSSVIVNDKELNKENYVVKSGSTILTLNKKYLDTLEKGTYTLKLEYNDGGYVETTFIIEEKVPNTFDGISTYIILSIVSLIGLCITILFTRKNKK